MTTTTTPAPAALRQYRNLPRAERAAYDPSGKPGAAEVRQLQAVARAVAALRDARHQARTNPEFPAARLDAARREFRGLAHAAPALERERAQQARRLPLGSNDADWADSAARASSPRRTNWLRAGSTLAPTPWGDWIAHAIHYKGAHRGRTGINGRPVMRAHARISTDGALLSALIGQQGSTRRPEACHTVAAGRGYRWEADANGIRIVRVRDGADYHPTTDDVRAGRAHIVAALRERADTRKKLAATARREKAILAAGARGGVWVAFGDSITGGNCRAGTESFCRRHGLSVSAHYRADTLPRPSTPDESRRVALAVLAATRRQAREIAAGRCEIAPGVPTRANLYPRARVQIEVRA